MRGGLDLHAWLGTSSQMHLDFDFTNASRVPSSSSVDGSAAPPTWSGRMCVDNNLEAAITGVHAQLRQKPIRDRIDEEEPRRGLRGRAAESSNCGLIPRAGL
jgi:hypothetical protein